MTSSRSAAESLSGRLKALEMVVRLTPRACATSSSVSLRAALVPATGTLARAFAGASSMAVAGPGFSARRAGIGRLQGPGRQLEVGVAVGPGVRARAGRQGGVNAGGQRAATIRSEEHTSELQ